MLKKEWVLSIETLDSLIFMCFLSIIIYSNILRIKIKSVYVKDFLISTKVRLKRGEHLHGEEPISSEPTFSTINVATPCSLH